MRLTKRQKEMLQKLGELGGKGRLYHDLLITPRIHWKYAGPTHTAATARVSHQLEEKGLVRILKNVGKHRETWVELTEKGKNL
jgi:hypothetical protein